MTETSGLPAHGPNRPLQRAALAVRQWGDNYRVPPKYQVFLQKERLSGGGPHDVRRGIEGAIAMLQDRGLWTYAQRVRYEWGGMLHKAYEIDIQLSEDALESLSEWDHDDTDPEYAWDVRFWQPMADGISRRIGALARELSDVLLGLDAEVSRLEDTIGAEEMSRPMTKKAIADKLGFSVHRNRNTQRYDYRPFDKVYGHALTKQSGARMYRVKLWAIDPSEAEKLR